MAHMTHVAALGEENVYNMRWDAKVKTINKLVPFCTEATQKVGKEKCLPVSQRIHVATPGNPIVSKQPKEKL
jgi:hypothetical protein